MRNSLVTQFACTKCGDFLELSYEYPSHPMHSNHYEMMDKITGAAKVQKVIGVEPCKKCFSAIADPLRVLREAIYSVKDSAGVEQR